MRHEVKIIMYPPIVYPDHIDIRIRGVVRMKWRGLAIMWREVYSPEAVLLLIEELAARERHEKLVEEKSRRLWETLSRNRGTETDPSL